MTLAQVFSFEICEVFKNTFFYRTPLVAASEYIKLLFSDKSSTSKKVIFIENDIILDKNDDIAEVLKIFFTNAVPKLDIL